MAIGAAMFVAKEAAKKAVKETAKQVAMEAKKEALKGKLKETVKLGIKEEVKGKVKEEIDENIVDTKILPIFFCIKTYLQSFKISSRQSFNNIDFLTQKVSKIPKSFIKT